MTRVPTTSLSFNRVLLKTRAIGNYLLLLIALEVFIAYKRQTEICKNTLPSSNYKRELVTSRKTCCSLVTAAHSKDFNQIIPVNNDLLNFINQLK